MIKGIPSGSNIFTGENETCYVYHPIPYNRPSLYRDHQTATIMNPCCYCFDGLRKVKKVKYTVFRLNALAKLQNARRASRHPNFIGNCPTCNHLP